MCELKKEAKESPQISISSINVIQKKEKFPNILPS